MEAKKAQGKKKIEIKFIEDKDHRVVTFTKRRNGIYKKICELATLCGAEIGIVIFSTTGKPYSFGVPNSVESIVKRFMNNNQPQEDDIFAHPLVKARRPARINNLLKQMNSLQDELDLDKENKKYLKRMGKGKEIDREWWNTPIEKLNPKELEQLNKSIDELYNKLYIKIIERSTIGASSSLPPPQN